MNSDKKAYREFSDADLAKLISSGDHMAFTELYDRYRGLLYLHAYKLTQDTEEAEDIVQDIFIYLYDKAGTLVFNTGIRSYLYSAVRYKFFNLLDHKKVITKYEESFNQFASNGEFITDDQVRENELTRLIEQEIAKLPEKMRMVFELRRKEHLSASEIAERLNISDKTVKKQLGNAVKILKVKFGNLHSVLFTGFL
jgi:RNA polymerase sigma-70 factor (ECF subfamily)